MANMFKKDRNIDIVFCIDATSSMGPCIDNVRRNATKFYQDFKNEMITTYNSEIASLRVQVVVFRDLECDVEALEKSEFFELPSDTRLFENYLNSITPRGGGDYKESGIEALYTAMNTDWIAKGMNDRQLIVLFTDADAIGFKEKRNRPDYPNVCDKDLFLRTWGGKVGNLSKIQERCKRLVIYAPAKSVYENELVPTLNRSVFVPVTPMKGMADVEFDGILKTICASAST